MMNQKELITALREALAHLYDAEQLRKSPLASTFQISNQPDTALALRKILTQAIEALKPKSDTPSAGRDWRIYETLYYTYVRQLSQQIVADQLALSVRHLRREQQAALEVLADHLLENIQGKSEVVDQKESKISPIAEEEPEIRSDLAWLRDMPTEEPVDLQSLLREAVDLISNRARENQVMIHLHSSSPLPSVAIYPVAINQILISLLDLAISNAVKGQIHVEARSVDKMVEVLFTSGTPVSEVPAVGNAQAIDVEPANLNVVHQLVELCGGSLQMIGQSGRHFTARLILPTLNQVTILAIDDNEDIHQLLQRYTTGTRFHIISTNQPSEVVKLTELHAPKAILLDVMMPQMDGWKLMAHIRHHPATQQIPIIICTILPQEKLAFSLGANGFLQKPIKRQALLEALNQMISQNGT